MPTENGAFDLRLETLDLSLFDKIKSASTDEDHRCWLAVQRSVRRPSGYTYLEIGSFRGGSIQQHLLDPWCRKIISIDKRPFETPHVCGPHVQYDENSTARMLENLRKVAPEEIGKVCCFEMDAKDVDRGKITEPPDFCFIDGEHTHAAVLSDFEFCLSVCAPDAAICFHDALTMRKALGDILSSIRRRGVPCTTWKVDGGTFGIFLRKCPAPDDPYIRAYSYDGLAWLRAMRIWGLLPSWMRAVSRSGYRRFAHRP